MPLYKLVCSSCHSRFDPNNNLYTCSKCESPLDIRFDFFKKEKNLIDTIKNPKGLGVWDYAPFLPVKLKETITMGEGNTPLVYAKNIADKLNIDGGIYIKNETLNPTGTFKDRCMTVAITKAIELGADGIILGSAGNAASSAAAYAARANLPCYVLIPAVTPIERVVQTAMYGGRIIQIDGTVNDCIDMIKSVQKRYKWHNVTTAAIYNPYQGEGPKTIAYEIARQLNWEVPNWILVPIGGGGLLSAIWRGFKDLYELKIINKLPKMIGMQAAGCAAVVKAFKEEKKSKDIADWGKPDTIAAAIADPYPLDGVTALDSIYESNGYSEWVTDEEILAGQRLVALCEGVFAEPASSTTIAGLMKLRKNNVINETDKVVCIVTGTGLKDPKIAITNVKQPPKIPKDIDKVLEAISIEVRS